MAKNANLHAAKTNKNDEFYTQMKDIEDELVNYQEHFRGKTIFLNCDDPASSNFWKWFEMRFEILGLKRLISTHYEMDGSPSYMLELTAKGGRRSPVKTPLEGNGDFRSDECVALLDEADIVVTNPPFSLFREFVALLMEHKKKFLIIGNKNSVTYKEIFPLLKNNEIWLGHFSPQSFIQPNGVITKKLAGLTRWFTNLEHDRRHQPMILYKHYSPDKYPTYDNYDAIEVGEAKLIPNDYGGIMGVPISWLDKYCPEQFLLLGHEHDINGNGGDGIPEGEFIVNGKGVYKRILIRNLNPKQPKNRKDN